jgi:hypothetical protein
LRAASIAVLPAFFSPDYIPAVWGKKKKTTKIFGGFRENEYLCTRKRKRMHP